MTEAGPQQRRRSVPVDVGGVLVGGGAPVVVQSMTNTDTADAAPARLGRREPDASNERDRNRAAAQWRLHTPHRTLP